MPKTEIPGMGKRARVYTGIYRYFTIPVYTLRNTPAAILDAVARGEPPRLDSYPDTWADLREGMGGGAFCGAF
jgi:hypothetical protein